MFHLTRKHRILALGALGLLLSYAALGFWLAPRLVRAQIEDFSQQHWQRKPSLGAISVNPFTLALEIQQFEFRDSRAEPLLSFARLRLNVDVSSLWRRGLSFHEIELDGPSARVQVHDDGSLNLAELTAPFATDETPAEAEPLRLFIDRFQLREGALEFEDHARQTPFKARLTPVNFELRDFDTTRSGEADGRNHYLLQATSTAGEKFRWSGRFGLAPLSSRGEFELAEVQARTLWSYLQESLGFEVSAGTVALLGDYEFAATEPDLTVKIGLDRVSVDGLKVRPRGGEQDWVSLNRLSLGPATLDLTQRVIDVSSVKLTEGSLELQRSADGRVNLLQLLESPTAGTPPPAADAAPGATPDTGGEWTVNIPELAIENFQVHALDEFVKPAANYQLSPVNLSLRGFTTRPGQSMDLEGGLTLDQGGQLELAGKASPAAKTFAGRVRLQQLNLEALQPYIGAYTQMTLLSGLLDTDIEMEVAPEALRVRGVVESSRLRTVDDALREDFIKWDRLSLQGLDFRQGPGAGPGRLRIDDIVARSPYVRFIIAPDQTTNVAKVLTPPPAAPGPVQTVRGASERPTGMQQPMAMDFGRIRIQNGSANFADFWITPNYAVSLQQLDGTLTGLSSRKDSRARLALQGKIDRYAPAEISGELNLLSASLFTDLRVKFDGVELTSVTPYSGRFAGYRIEKGKLSVNVRYLVENRKLDAEQRFVIDQLSLGERVDSPDAVKLPLRLAVALLKDRNGVIDLGLPVTGSLDDPKFRVGPIVWKAFVNLLSGIATSPFKLLGGLFGGGEEVNLIEFDAGSATLDDAATTKLTALGQALRERPQLALEVPATYAPDADLAALARSQLEMRLRELARTRKLPEDAAADPAQRFELLLAVHESDSTAALTPGVLTLTARRARDRDATAITSANGELELLLRPGEAALQPALQSLAQERARVVQDALLGAGEIDPARVFLVAPVAAPAANGRARLALSLR